MLSGCTRVSVQYCSQPETLWNTVFLKLGIIKEQSFRAADSRGLFMNHPPDLHCLWLHAACTLSTVPCRLRLKSYCEGDNINSQFRALEHTLSLPDALHNAQKVMFSHYQTTRHWEWHCQSLLLGISSIHSILTIQPKCNASSFERIYVHPKDN